MSTREVQLDAYYEEIQHTLLAFQSHTLGLFPRGQSGHARVRDNVYCAMAVWSLALAYRHVGNDYGRGYELEQTAVKCMRGILFCYMKQSHRLEQFKQRQLWQDALHARFDCTTGESVTPDSKWGHLQIDGPAMFLLLLAQMTISGLKVILTTDEVCFVQNLVYYIERAYRIPDFGMWERGTKENINKRELHASSVAMAKAALEAINGVNMFGEESSSLIMSVIHVDPDAHYRNSSILNTLLPKESSSKDTDAALLCVVGFPAFAIDDKILAQKTYDRALSTLEGSCGLMRFTRDSHHTVKEDRSKTQYDRQELDEFAGIECEWPMFYLYTFLTAMFAGDKTAAEEYWEKMEQLLVPWQDDKYYTKIVPKFYYVPESAIESTSQTSLSGRQSPAALKRVPSEEQQPFLWAQALYLMARLLRDELVSVNELDPAGRHRPVVMRNCFHSHTSYSSSFRVSDRDVVVQVALIAETKRLQTILSTHGIPTQTMQQVEPVKIVPPSELIKLMENIGANKKLSLTGRPGRPIGGLGTSRVYRMGNTTMMLYPNEVDLVDFYISLDMLLLIDHLRSLLQFICLHWNLSGRPTVCLFLRESIFVGSHFSSMISFLADLKSGRCSGVNIKVDRLQALIPTSCIEHLDFLQDEVTSILFQSRTSSKVSLYSNLSGTTPHLLEDPFSHDTGQPLEQSIPDICEPKLGLHETEKLSSEDLAIAFEEDPSLLGKGYILYELIKRHGEHHTVSLDGVSECVLIEKVEEVYEEAGSLKDWSAVRFTASLLHKHVDSLSPSITAVIVREKELTIGVFNCDEYTITEPLPPAEVKGIIYDTCFKHDLFECVLQQELIIYLGSLVHLYPHVYDGMLKIRIGWIIEAMKKELVRLHPAERRPLHSEAPNSVKDLLLKVLKPMSEGDNTDYLYMRQLNGALSRVPVDFFPKVYQILVRVQGGLSVRGRHLPQYPTIIELLGTEKTFAVRVEGMLSSIGVPEYRQAIVELLMVIHTVLDRNVEVVYCGTLDLDMLLADAIHLHNVNSNGVADKSQNESAPSLSSTNFFAHPPAGANGTIAAMTKAVVDKLIRGGSLNLAYAQTCCVS